MNRPQKRPAIPWRSRLPQPWIAAAIFIAWYLCQAPSQWQYDSFQLVLGCDNILSWLQGHSTAIRYPRPYPLFQYPSGLVAAWATERGFPVNIAEFWAACSLLSLAGIILVFHRVAKQINQPTVGWAAMVLILSGPLLVYANCTFNETVSAFLILCFTAAAMRTARPLLCAVLFWVSGITKETAPVLLSVIWVGAIWINLPKMNRRQRFAQGVALLAALLATIVTNGGFNLFRYGTFWNREYLSPGMVIHRWSWRAQYAVALWISPNGGVAIFWPTLVIALVGILIIARRMRQSLAPATIIAIVLGGLTLGLSQWWQPFGWYSWGPRLMFPWMPACLLVLVQGYPQASSKFIDLCVGKAPAFVATTVFTCLFAVPHVMASAAPEIILPFFTTDARFTHGVPSIQMEQEYAQNFYFAWQKMPPMRLWPMCYAATPLLVAKALCFLAALQILLRQSRLALPGLHGIESIGPLTSP